MPAHPIGALLDADPIVAADVADAIERHTSFVAIGLDDIRTRDLARVKTIILVGDDGSIKRLVRNETSALEDDGLTCVWDNAERAFTLVAEGTEPGLLFRSDHGAESRHDILEEELTLAGASVDSTVLIPEGALVFAVSERVTEEVTGATSFDVGIAGTAGKFGATLALTLESTNRGLIGPDPFYAAEAVRLTANGSDFTGGKVRIAIHYFMPVPPTS